MHSCTLRRRRGRCRRRLARNWHWNVRAFRHAECVFRDPWFWEFQTSIPLFGDESRMWQWNTRNCFRFWRTPNQWKKKTKTITTCSRQPSVDLFCVAAHVNFILWNMFRESHAFIQNFVIFYCFSVLLVNFDWRLGVVCIWHMTANMINKSFSLLFFFWQTETACFFYQCQPFSVKWKSLKDMSEMAT